MWSVVEYSQGAWRNQPTGGPRRGAHPACGMSPASDGSEDPEQFGETEHKLAMALCQVNTHLRDKRIGQCELSERKARDGELRDAKYAQSELRNADNAAAELADGDYAPRHHGCSIGPELERNMQERQPGNRQPGFVLVAPSIP